MIPDVEPLAKSSFWETKLSPNELFDFDPPPPPPALHVGTTFLRGVGWLQQGPACDAYWPRMRRFGPVSTVVGKTWLTQSRHCAPIRTLVHPYFFFYMGPLANDGVLGAISNFPTSPPPWGPASEDLSVCRPP